MKARVAVVSAIGVCLALVGAFVFAAGEPEVDEDVLWTRTPNVIIGFGAGGGTDTSLRPVVAKMEEYLGEPINVTNMEGASSALAAEHVLAQPRDGHYMFGTGSGPLSNFRVMGLSDTCWRDWTGWHPFIGPSALLVHPDSGIETFDEAMQAMEDDVLNFAISGYGVGPHVIAEAMLEVAGIDEVNYVTTDSCRDSATEVMAEEAHITMVTFSAAVDFVEAGELRGLAVISEDPYEIAGQDAIPAITDVLPGSDHVPLLAETWPLLIPRDTPQHVLDALTEAFEWAMEQDSIIEYAEEQALEVAGFYGEEADEFLSISEAGYSWTVYNAGLAEYHPDDFDIPTLEEHDWETQREAIAGH